MSTRRSDDIQALAAALVAAQSAMKPAIKDATNLHFKSRYADLASVWDAAREPLTTHGLCVVQAPDILDGRDVLITTLLHTSGQWISSVYPLTATQATPQAMGSSLTYARRYTLMALVGIAPEDDDGNAASERVVDSQTGELTPRQTPRPAPSARPAPRDETTPDGVTIKTIYGDKAPYAVILSDGRKATFFSESLLKNAHSLKADGLAVGMKIDTVKKGTSTYHNLMRIWAAAAAEPELPMPPQYDEDMPPLPDDDDIQF